MKRLLLINDTSEGSNPGCKAASGSLLKALSKRGHVVSRIPVGYRADDFALVSGVRPRCVVKKKGYFNTYDQVTTELDFEKWLSLSSEVYGRDIRVLQAIQTCDEIIVNAEGTVHHNFKRAVALLALIYEVTKSGKPTVVVNSSVMAMDQRVLATALQGVSLFHARESLSAGYVSHLCPDLLVRRCPDLAFNIDIGSETGTHKSSTRKGVVLVTPGVLSTPQQLDDLIKLISPLSTQTIFLSIGDGGESPLFFDICDGNRVSIVKSSEYTWQKIVELLSSCDLVVSGRHHINIFCMLTGVPFIAIPSNTWKIEGTLHDVGNRGLPLSTYDDLSHKLEEVRRDGRNMLITPRGEVETAVQNVRKFLTELSYGNYNAF